jgi:hypothetical protein
LVSDHGVAGVPRYKVLEQDLLARLHHDSQGGLKYEQLAFLLDGLDLSVGQVDLAAATDQRLRVERRVEVHRTVSDVQHAAEGERFCRNTAHKVGADLLRLLEFVIELLLDEDSAR